MDERAFMAAPTAPTKRKTTATDVPAAKKQKAVRWLHHLERIVHSTDTDRSRLGAGPG